MLAEVALAGPVSLLLLLALALPVRVVAVARGELTWPSRRVVLAVEVTEQSGLLLAQLVEQLTLAAAVGAAMLVLLNPRAPAVPVSLSSKYPITMSLNSPVVLLLL
jgi:hypothetical protein